MEGTTQQRRKERLELGTRCAGIDRIQVALTIGGQDQKGGVGSSSSSHGNRVVTGSFLNRRRTVIVRDKAKKGGFIIVRRDTRNQTCK